MACLSGGSYISQAFPSWTNESQGLSIPGSRSRDKKRRRRRRGRAPTNDGLMEGRNGFSMSSGRESISRFSDETIRTAIAFSSNGLDYADAVIHFRRE